MCVFKIFFGLWMCVFVVWLNTFIWECVCMCMIEYMYLCILDLPWAVNVCVSVWLNTCLCVFKIFYRLWICIILRVMAMLLDVCSPCPMTISFCVWFNTCMCAFKISHGLCMIEYMYDFDFANIWMSFKCQHLNAWICPCDSCIIGLFYAHIWMSNLKSCIHSLRFFSLNNSNVMNALLKKVVCYVSLRKYVLSWK